MSAGMTTNPMPSFNRPPVVETVLGIDFEPLEDWQIQHFGLFLHALRTDANAFRRVKTQPPLTTPPEKFPPHLAAPMQIELSD